MNHAQETRRAWGVDQVLPNTKDAEGRPSAIVKCSKACEEMHSIHVSLMVLYKSVPKLTVM